MDGRCDRVIDSKKRGDCRCNRKAKVVSNRTQFVPGHGDIPYRLAYCSRHEKHAHHTELPSLRVVNVEVMQ